MAPCPQAMRAVARTEATRRTASASEGAIGPPGCDAPVDSAHERYCFARMNATAQQKTRRRPENTSCTMGAVSQKEVQTRFWHHGPGSHHVHRSPIRRRQRTFYHRLSRSVGVGKITTVCICDGSADRPMAWGSLARLERLVVLGGELSSTSSMGLDRPLLDRSNRLNRGWVGALGRGIGRGPGLAFQGG